MLLGKLDSHMRKDEMGPLFYTSETDIEEENRYVEFINVIQNSPLRKQKTLIKLIKTSYWHE